MGKSRVKAGVIFVSITIIIGLALAGVVMYTINRFNEQVSVVVVTREIAPFTQIRPEHVTVIQLPAAAQLPNSYASTADVIGQVSRTWLLPQDQIREGHLAIGAGANMLTNQLSGLNNPSLRAAAVPVDLINGLGGAKKLQAGDKVNVITTVHGTSVTIMQQVPILTFIEEQEKTQGIVLAVTQEQAEQIASALANGAITLTLNPYR